MQTRTRSPPKTPEKMVRLSNTLIGVINIVTFLLSIPILVAGIWLSKQEAIECDRFLAMPVIVAGVFLLAVSIVGMIGSFCRVSFLLWFYFLVMLLLILLLFCFTIFAFVVTNKGPHKEFKEYRLEDYSNWLQKRVGSEKNWTRIKSCLQDSKVCQSLIDKSPTNFNKTELPPIQSGCCTPPEECNFQYEAPTNWTRTPSSNLSNPDCTAWKSNSSMLCYDCQPCKVGMLDHIKSNLKKVAVVNIVFLVFLIIIYYIGCCAFRKKHEDLGSDIHKREDLGSEILEK